MIIAINSFSALEFWRKARFLAGTDQYSFQSRSLASLPQKYEFKMTSKFAGFLADQLMLSKPLHVLSPTAESRCRIANAICNVRPKHLPAKSFVEIKFPGISPGVIILMASPELCFVQMAKFMSFEELLVLGYEFCGTYVLDETADYGIRSRKPLTSVKSINTFISSIRYIDGLSNARCAAKYILDGAASPRESGIAIIATLPISRGGYALKGLRLNKKVILSASGMSILRQSEIIVDGIWEDSRLVIEYDSNSTHLSVTQHARDKNRTAALSHSGYTVVPITSDDLNNFKSMEKTFCAIRKSLGKRAQKADLRKYESKRKSLAELLFWH